jgi:hypothetical protein
MQTVRNRNSSGPLRFNALYFATRGDFSPEGGSEEVFMIPTSTVLIYIAG